MRYQQKGLASQSCRIDIYSNAGEPWHYNMTILNTDHKEGYFTGINLDYKPSLEFEGCGWVGDVSPKCTIRIDLKRHKWKYVTQRIMPAGLFVVMSWVRQQFLR